MSDQFSVTSVIYQRWVVLDIKKMKSNEDSGKSTDKNAETGSRNHHTNSTENHPRLVDRQSEKEPH